MRIYGKKQSHDGYFRLCSIPGGSPGVKEAVQLVDEIVFNPLVLGELKAGFFPLLPCSMD
jgi:hypothetical protein